MRGLLRKTIRERRVWKWSIQPRPDGAPLCLRCHQRSASSLCARGVNKRCFPSPADLSERSRERRKAREQVDLKEQEPGVLVACVTCVRVFRSLVLLGACSQCRLEHLDPSFGALFLMCVTAECAVQCACCSFHLNKMIPDQSVQCMLLSLPRTGSRESDSNIINRRKTQTEIM